MNVQTKIYSGVGHVDVYSDEMKKDCKMFADSVLDGKEVQEQLEDIKGMESKQREFISIISHDKLNEGQNI